MISNSTRYKAYILLKSIAENEYIVEEQRDRLANMPDWEPYSAFKRIARVNSDLISAFDICNFLRDN
jgi:hypothetical protein